MADPGGVLVVARVTARSGCQEALQAALESLLRASEGEAGLLHWALGRGGDFGDVFVITEAFVSRAAYDAHEEAPEVTRASAAMASLIESVEATTGSLLGSAGGRTRH